MTFAVVYSAWPRGYPGGIAYPAGSKKRCRWSTPSSMIPILIPAPAFGRSAAGSSRARIVAASGPASTWYVVGANTSRTPGSPARRGRSRVREDDGDTVRDEPVAPVHRRARDRARSAFSKRRCSSSIRRARARASDRAAAASGGARRPGSGRPAAAVGARSDAPPPSARAATRSERASARVTGIETPTTAACRRGLRYADERT